MLYLKRVLKKINAFLKERFLFPPKFQSPIIICRRNLKFLPVGFGYKITSYINFHQNQKGSGKKNFL